MSFILKLNVFSKLTSAMNLSHDMFTKTLNGLFLFIKFMRNFLSDADGKIPRSLIQLRNQQRK